MQPLDLDTSQTFGKYMKLSCYTKEVTSYTPIFLLPITSKLFEKILLKKLKLTRHSKTILRNQQFGFREKYSTIEQVHNIINIYGLEKKTQQ